jgi:hypothetical protein
MLLLNNLCSWIWSPKTSSPVPGGASITNTCGQSSDRVGAEVHVLATYIVTCVKKSYRQGLPVPTPTGSYVIPSHARVLGILPSSRPNATHAQARAICELAELVS